MKRKQGENHEKELVDKTKLSKFSLQIDETIINKSDLLHTCVGYSDEMAILEEILFMKKQTDTRS